MAVAGASAPGIAGRFPGGDSMDPQLVQGLRDAKQLLDEGILTQAEFQQQKQLLLGKYAHAPDAAKQPADTEKPGEIAGRSAIAAGDTDAGPGMHKGNGTTPSLSLQAKLNDPLPATLDPPPAFDQAEALEGSGAKWCDLCTEALEGGTRKFDVNLSCALLQEPVSKVGSTASICTAYAYADS